MHLGLVASLLAASEAVPGGSSRSALLIAGRFDATADSTTCECTITAQKLGRPPIVGHAGPRREPTRYLFLLGYPFTGTTAVHLLLAQGANVSALDNADEKVGRTGHQEGWWKLGWKHRPDKWSGPDSAFDWKNLSEVYHSHWNLSQPLLLEKSPPEMNHADALNRTFSPRGKVRFVVLAHSMCAHGGEVSNVCDPSEGNRTSHEDCWAQRAAQAVDIARRFGDDAVIVRYEDLCLQWEETTQALESWEPLLGGIGLLSGGTPIQRLTRHGHSHSELVSQTLSLALALTLSLALTPTLPRASMSTARKSTSRSGKLGSGCPALFWQSGRWRVCTRLALRTWDTRLSMPAGTPSEQRRSSCRRP